MSNTGASQSYVFPVHAFEDGCMTASLVSCNTAACTARDKFVCMQRQHVSMNAYSELALSVAVHDHQL